MCFTAAGIEAQLVSAGSMCGLDTINYCLLLFRLVNSEYGGTAILLSPGVFIPFGMVYLLH